MKTQRGAITAVTLLFILVVVSLFLVTTMKMISSTTIDTLEQSESTEMLYLAESALERGAYRLNTTGNCDATITDPSPINFSRGQIQVVSAVLVSNCLLKVAGLLNTNNLPRSSYLQATYKSNFLANGNLGETFPSSANFTANWATTLIESLGTVAWNNFGGAYGGVFRARTNGGGSTNSHLTGYSRRLLPAVVPSGSTGRTGNVSLVYQRSVANGATADRMDLSVALWDSVAGIGTILWSKTTLTEEAAMTAVNNIPFTLPANRNYDQVRIVFQLDELGSNRITVYIDNINITIPASGSGWSLVDWRQIDN